MLFTTILKLIKDILSKSIPKATIAYRLLLAAAVPSGNTFANDGVLPVDSQINYCSKKSSKTSYDINFIIN